MAGNISILSNLELKRTKYYINILKITVISFAIFPLCHVPPVKNFNIFLGRCHVPLIFFLQQIVVYWRMYHAFALEFFLLPSKKKNSIKNKSISININGSNCWPLLCSPYWKMIKSLLFGEYDKGYYGNSKYLIYKAYQIIIVLLISF